ncbi:AraC family transcriptional regulator [Lunatimonas salinarum]|uniref:AraC family transcriptional regulator n=1 Tax=Lunatimonas salinarum TaxID=1774590 RepID=UPI001ADF2707|nr:AraC family transcriptional regulator [Lunatimonas salinarum]
MKAQLIGRYINGNQSVTIQHYSSRNFLKIWHYHPEYELDIILTSKGTRFVGDSVDKFMPGDIVLLGQNLPHLWLNNNAYFEEGSALTAEAIVIHFGEKFVSGLGFIPELAKILTLITKADCGIAFRGAANEGIIQSAKEMIKSSGHQKVLFLMDILARLSIVEEHSLLSSPGFVNSFSQMSKNRMGPVYDFVISNFKQEIRLDTVAAIANMNSSSFSRYFSHCHKKSFTQFVNEIRVGYACKLLIEDHYNISQVCFESGFNNISNFNRVFKSLKKSTPSEYLKLHSLK